MAYLIVLNFLALAATKILGGPKFTLGGLRTFDAP